MSIRFPNSKSSSTNILSRHAFLVRFRTLSLVQTLRCDLFFLIGRAGRYGSSFPVGEVTCLDANDLPLLHSSLNSPSPILEVWYCWAKIALHYVENFLFIGSDAYKLRYIYVKSHPTRMLIALLIVLCSSFVPLCWLFDH